MHELVLDGCRPVPLAGYLKALGVLRLVSEQADPAARGWWDGDRFRLKTTLDRSELKRFLLEDYRPTPAIAPWNAGSGFYFREAKSKEKDPATGKKLKLGIRDEETEATKTLAKFERSSASRLSGYRHAIVTARTVIKELGLDAAPSGGLKDRLIHLLRSVSPLDSLAWIDAAAVLLPDGAKYPPLLGTGGNDGNLDFSTNFLQRIGYLFRLDDGTPTDQAVRLVEGSLFQTLVLGMQDTAIGQFSPGDAGGPNSTAGFEGPARVNAWDFVLMLEGAIGFAGGVSRKLEGAGGAHLSYPFMVRATAAGFGSASLEEQVDSRGELWAPLWGRPATYAEVRVLFREGRLSVGARPARDGLDAARAAGALGADRRIKAFERYGFVKRQGLAYLATPLGRRKVEPNPQSELLFDLDRGGWLGALRVKVGSTEATGEFNSAVLSLEDRLFALIERPHQTQTTQSVLAAVGHIARIVATRPKLRDGMGSIAPPPQLRAAWIDASDDRSPEFRLAVALAGLRAPLAVEATDGQTPRPSEPSPSPRLGLPLRAHLGPLDAAARPHQPRWDPESGGDLVVWSAAGLVDNLCAVARRRLLEQNRRGLDQAPFDGAAGVDSGEIAAFLDGTVRDETIADLLLGLAWGEPGRWTGDRRAAPLPFAYAALKPLFTPRHLFERLKREGLRLPMPPAVPQLLAAGRVQEAVRLAQERARASGLPNPFLDRRPSQVAGRASDHRFGRRLLAALTIPVSVGVVGACLDQAYPSSDEEPKDAA